jgi:transposase
MNEELSAQYLLDLSYRRRYCKIAGRLRAVGLYLLGENTVPEIEDIIGRGKHYIYHWVNRFKASGLKGLEDRKGRGRTERLTSEQKKKFIERVKSGPIKEDVVSVFTLLFLTVVMKKEYGKTMTESGMGRFLRRNGMSLVKPRPVHPKNDKAAMKTFREETLPLFYQKFAKKTRRKESQ